MLANVERVQMKSELAYFAQQRTEVGMRQPLSAIRLQAFLDEQQILFELRDICVSRRSAHDLAALLQPMKHIRKEPAIALSVIVRSPRQMHSWNRPFVALKPVEKFRGNSSLPPRRAEAIAERFHIVEILTQDQGSRHGQSAANTIRLDQRISVAVATDPGSKLHDVGDRIFVERKRVNVAESFDDFVVDSG